MADITIRTKNGEVKTFSDVSREQLEQVISRAKNGEFEVLGNENKPINFHTDEKIDKPNPNAINYPDMGNPVYNKIARSVLGAGYGAATGGMVGGPWGAAIGGLTNAASPPNTYSEALLTPLLGKTGGKVSEVLSNSKALQTVPRQALVQGLAMGGGNVAEGATNNFFEKLLDPNQSIKDTRTLPERPEDVLQAIGLGMLGGGIGAYSQHIKQGIPKSPTFQANKAYQTMTGETSEPYDLYKKIKEIQDGNVPNAANTLSKVREEEKLFQETLKDKILETELNKNEIVKKRLKAKKVEEQATRQNRELIADNEVEKIKEISPERVYNERRLKQTQDEINKILKNKITPESKARLEELRTQRKGYLDYNRELKAQAEALTIENLMRREEHTDLPENMKSYNKNSRAYEYQVKEKEFDSEVKSLVRMQERSKFGAATTSLLKGIKNSEELPVRLLEADPPAIREFMKQTSEIPHVKEAVINEILQQSWDGKTFGNFSKMFEKSGNVKLKLAEVLGDKDKADRTIEAIQLMNEGLVKSQAINSDSRAIRGIAKAHMVWQAGKHLVSGMGSTLAAEQAALHVLKIPTMVEKVVQDKDKFERWKKWMQTGMTKEFIQKGNPLYQELLDMGDKYTYDDYGNPKLVSK